MNCPHLVTTVQAGWIPTKKAEVSALPCRQLSGAGAWQESQAIWDSTSWVLMRPRAPGGHWQRWREAETGNNVRVFAVSSGKGTSIYLSREMVSLAESPPCFASSPSQQPSTCLRICAPLSILPQTPTLLYLSKGAFSVLCDSDFGRWCRSVCMCTWGLGTKK